MAEWFVVMTLQAPLPDGGFASSTKSGVVTLGPDATRAAVYEQMLGLFPPPLAGTANVVFFSAEPNRIGDR